MANVALSFVPSVVTFPFEIPGGATAPNTAIPRARLTLNINSVVITAKGANDTTSIAIAGVLPANFVYTLEYATVNINVVDDVGDADNFDDIGTLTYVNMLLGPFSRVNMVAPGIFGVAANAGSGKAWEPDNPYGGPLFNQAGDDILISIDINDNNAAATNEGVMSSIMTVLQYDIAQAFKFPMNFPLPVTSRGA